jgi:hypothetical protein
MRFPSAVSGIDRPKVIVGSRQGRYRKTPSTSSAARVIGCREPAGVGISSAQRPNETRLQLYRDKNQASGNTGFYSGLPG